MEKENFKLNGGNLLLETMQKIGDFGDPKNLLLKKVFFDISENLELDKEIRDLATELMLYCEEDELNVFEMKSKEEIIKKITIILQS